MTPTLLGRIQTRLFLMLTIGLLITLLFMWLLNSSEPFYILLYATVIGFLWDILYIGIQNRRWDRDWPFGYQFIAGITEGIFLLFLIRTDLMASVNYSLPLSYFLMHYGAVFLVTFTLLLGPLQIFFPSWRFKGGEFGRW